MAGCASCLHKNVHTNVCEVCLGGTHYKPRRKTNADRIRSMADEELADYFSELSCWPNARREVCRGMANCMDCWLDWLKSPAEEGE